MRQFLLHFIDKNDELDITTFCKDLDLFIKNHGIVGDFSEMINPFWREQKDNKGYG